ncbi:hypothetical protein AB6A40_008776 [Gnathostoma spinigerum]|uniref:Uncharacterized protein n=1 Tax=Gnathostoma spinigerum TaxID=75299 RepID=A0ABD6EZA3_9BILA
MDQHALTLIGSGVFPEDDEGSTLIADNSYGIDDDHIIHPQHLWRPRVEGSDLHRSTSASGRKDVQYPINGKGGSKTVFSIMLLAVTCGLPSWCIQR